MIDLKRRIGKVLRRLADYDGADAVMQEALEAIEKFDAKALFRGNRHYYTANSLPSVETPLGGPRDSCERTW